MTHSRLFDDESPESDPSDPASPCIGVCQVEAGGVCVGCYRTLSEIAEWSAASAEHRSEIKRAAEGRRLASMPGSCHRRDDVDE